MKRQLMLTLLILSVITSALTAGCGEELQTLNKHGISFTVSRELKLEEYSVNFEKQTFQRGTASYEQGAVISTEKNFMLLWLTAVPQFSPAEVRTSILSTPNSFESVSGNFQAEIAGELVKQKIAGFEVTSAGMQFTMPGWEAPGITAVWYCADSRRTMQVVLIHKQPETELKRFMESFSSQ
jgi:hypothetical protein